MFSIAVKITVDTPICVPLESPSPKQLTGREVPMDYRGRKWAYFWALFVFLFGVAQDVYANGADSFINFRPGARETRGRYTVYDLPRNYAEPHCLAVDPQGNIWF